MPNCTNCSAPLPLNSITCDYCGSRNNVDLTEVNYFTVHDIEVSRNCPVCSVPLKTIDLGIKGRFLIERCEECLGLFFDPGELEALLEYSVKNVFEINRSRLELFTLSPQAKSRIATYVKCPVCAKMMNRINFGARSGVVIDRCREHGAWLDAGELRQLCEWMKAGGKILDNEKIEERKKEELTAEKKRQNSIQLGAISDYDDPGLKIKSDPDLLEIIFKAVRFFRNL